MNKQLGLRVFALVLSFLAMYSLIVTANARGMSFEMALFIGFMPFFVTVNMFLMDYFDNKFLCEKLRFIKNIGVFRKLYADKRRENALIEHEKPNE
jgi:hypothetical protein